MKMEVSTDNLQELVELVKSRYGYDFGGYSEASLKRRFTRFANLAEVNFFELKHNIINDRSFFSWMLESLTVNVTEMFRDPAFFKCLVKEVLPVLSTYPFIKIWHAGCSSGEEAFSLAILLKEAGLLERSKIYATDMNPANLQKANAGIMQLASMRDYTANYQHAGGVNDFSNYYTARYDNAIISADIRESILFSQHNLVTDYVFNEFQLICCRNVFIYFNAALQNHVLQLFTNSLSPLGFLALGLKESILFSDSKDKFDEVSGMNKIYRLKG